MIIELTTLPPMVQQQFLAIAQGDIIQFANNGQVIGEFAKRAELSPRVPGRLAHLNLHFDEKELLAPLDDEELKWWNGDYTDDYGLSL